MLRPRRHRKEGQQAGSRLCRKARCKYQGYVTKEKGIDPARIEPRSAQGEQTADLWIVPAGATFPEAGTTAVDEAKVKAVPRDAMKAKKAHKKNEGQEGSERIASKLRGRPQSNGAPVFAPGWILISREFFMPSAIVRRGFG